MARFPRTLGCLIGAAVLGGLSGFSLVGRDSACAQQAGSAAERVQRELARQVTGETLKAERQKFEALTQFEMAQAVFFELQKQRLKKMGAKIAAADPQTKLRRRINTARAGCSKVKYEVDELKSDVEDLQTPAGAKRAGNADELQIKLLERQLAVYEALRKYHEAQLAYYTSIRNSRQANGAVTAAGANDIALAKLRTKLNEDRQRYYEQKDKTESLREEVAQLERSLQGRAAAAGRRRQ